MTEEDLAKSARDWLKGQSTPREEKYRTRQTTWANCLQQGTSVLPTAVMRSVQITQSPQLRISRPLHTVDQAQTKKPIGTHVVAGLRRAIKAENFLTNC